MAPRTFVFFGKSGSGKGTQAELLREKLRQAGRKILYVETGNLFREFTKRGDYVSSLTAETLKKGGLLPAFLPIWAWTDFLIENFKGREDLIFDGVSRRPDEAAVLKSAFDYFDIKDRYIIFINVSDQWALERLLARGRSDDNEKEIKSRLSWFAGEVAPVLTYFKNQPDCRFLEINGEQTIEEVHREILEKISGL